MKGTGWIDNVYATVDALIADLRTVGHDRLAAILDHRMRQVAWTDHSELIDELGKVLTLSLSSEVPALSQGIRDRVEQLLRDLRDW